MMRARSVAALLALFAFALAEARAEACAACGCGDPTLTAMGVEKPFKNRVRLALEERFGGHFAGDPSYQDSSWTLRSSLIASWSPTARFTVAALVPLVSEWVRAGPQPWQKATGLGDAELSARGVIFRDRTFSPRHMVSALGGIKIPTAPRAFDEGGYPLPDDSQPGSGSWDPFAGVGYGWFDETLSAFSSLSYRLTTVGRRDYRHGMSLGATAGVQLQPWERVAFSLSADLRWAAADRLASGVDAPNTGGTMIALTPSVSVSPVSNWIIKLSLQIHAGDWFSGTQSESNTLILATVVDLN